jgi:hypothetical protein
MDPGCRNSLHIRLSARRQYDKDVLDPKYYPVQRLSRTAPAADQLGPDYYLESAQGRATAPGLRPRLNQISELFPAL